MRSLQHWDNFWRQEYITTFGAALTNNYAGSIRHFWLNRFLELSPGSSILDVATGNGAVATIAALCSLTQNSNLSVFAADASVINQTVKNADKDILHARQSIHFHSRSPCEDLPFEDGKFALITSQFGIEYSDSEISVPELYRCLARGGQFVAISHSKDSSIYKQSLAERQVYRSATEDMDIFTAIANHLSTLEPTPPPRQPASSSVNSLVNGFLSRFERDPTAREIVNHISGVLRQSSPISVKIEALKKLEQDYREACQRLTDMAAAAWSSDDIAALKSLAGKTGFSTVNYEPFFSSDYDNIGWKIQMTK